MNRDEAVNIVIELVESALNGKVKVTVDMPLIGGASALDSMKLVEVCLALEDLADERGFEFDWTSDAAMSRSRSMFRTVASLAEELVQQSQGADDRRNRRQSRPGKCHLPTPDQSGESGFLGWLDPLKGWHSMRWPATSVTFLR